MPYDVSEALDRIQHPNPKRPQYDPYCWTVPAFGKRLQMAPDTYERNILDKKAINRIHSIVSTMLYYAQKVDPTMPRAINEILRVQSRQHGTKSKNKECYYTMQKHTRMQYFVINPVIRSYM